ncbi:MAG: hypothetical protein KJO97_04630, partial [Acidimicrobiia bacterium]|nr:hypothetical protein [Acidimicrobiia bacterium]
IAESDGKLRWEFWTAGKRDVSYQRHVIVGFDVANQRYNVDFDLIVGMYGHRLIRETEEEPEFFVGLLQGAADKV